MAERSKFPPVFWVANLIELLERYAYYGIYFGFGIYLASLGYSRDQLGIIQSLFLFFSYLIPVVSGTFADRFGFKKVLIVAYLAYLPAILLLLVTKAFSGIAAAMLCIGFAAGIFKPLIAGTVRLTTDASNATVGFGIFYAIVNIGGSFGPIVAGKLRAISWDYAFMSSAIAVGAMFVITLLFYKEPPRGATVEPLGAKLRGILTTLSDVKFASFLILLGLFFWLPFWGFFNLCALYVDGAVDTAALYRSLESGLAWIPLLGPWLLGLVSHEVDGVRRVLGESVSHTGYIVMLLQVPVSIVFERYRAMPSFIFGLAVAAVGFVVIGLAATGAAALVFLGILLFAVGEMITSPRIQEYITWIAPKDKAGLYMGSNFLGTMIGATLSGIYAPMYGHFERVGHPGGAWFVLAGHMVLAVVAFAVFVRVAGEFKLQTE
jgi:POT family proton-dependent oligopeptide transporter